MDKTVKNFPATIAPLPTPVKHTSPTAPTPNPPSTPPHPTQRLRHRQFATLREPSAGFSLSSLLSTLSSPLGGRAYSALPCAGAPPPQRPPSYNIPHRPGAYIGQVPIRKNSATPPPPAPSNPRRRRPCPRLRPHPRRFPLKRPRRGRPCACPRPPTSPSPPSPSNAPVGAGLVPALVPNQNPISPTAPIPAPTKKVDSGPIPTIHSN